MNSTTLPTASPHDHAHDEFLDHEHQRVKGAQLLNRAIAPEARMVIKRDGGRARFDLNKVTRAIALAFHDVRTENAPNPYRDDLLACFGLESDPFLIVTDIAASVSQMLELYYRDGRHPTIEQVQDLGASPCDPKLTAMLEAALVETGHPARTLVSGAGHDTMVMASLCPTAMLFIRCEGGVSHNPAEAVTADDAEAALQVMLRFIEKLGESEVG